MYFKKQQNIRMFCCYAAASFHLPNLLYARCDLKRHFVFLAAANIISYTCNVYLILISSSSTNLYWLLMETVLSCFHPPLILILSPLRSLLILFPHLCLGLIPVFIQTLNMALGFRNCKCP